METITENHSQSKCGVAESSYKNTSLTQFLNLRLGEYCGRSGRRNIKYKRVREFAMGLCLLEISKATRRSTNHHDCLNMSKDYNRHVNIDKELQATKEC